MGREENRGKIENNNMEVELDSNKKRKILERKRKLDYVQKIR